MRDHSSHSAELNHGSLFNIDAKVANGTWQWEAEREKLDCEIKLQESCKKKAEAKAGNHQHVGTRLKEGSARQSRKANHAQAKWTGIVRLKMEQQQESDQVEG